MSWNQEIPTIVAMVSIRMGCMMVPWFGIFWMVDVGWWDVFNELELSKIVDQYKAQAYPTLWDPRMLFTSSGTIVPLEI